MSQKADIKKLNKILCQVKEYRDQMKALSDNELVHMTEVFKKRLAKGETLDELLPEAYAVACEADYRVLGMFPHDAQILGAIALHQGYLAELNTGEGKTLVATMPLYLNALTGKSTMLVTTNEYLALRDAEEMGQMYRFMGLTVAAGVQRDAEMRFTNEEKQKIYAADIVYTTHGVFGFDYLLNNLVTSAEDRFLRELYYIIIDEADSVLLDSAQTPLVISGAPRVQSNLYEMADFFVTTLEEGRDYEVEDKKVWLTDEGVSYAERFFKIDNFYSREHFEINRHVILALRAHMLFEIEKEYMISKDGELHLLDGASGRMMPGVKLRGGQHQALEVKEKIEASMENRSVASITYQNLFRLFPKMSGMSGTISDAAEEIFDVYGTKVVVIPPHRPIQRKDMPDIYFSNAKDQFTQAIEMAVKTHKTGQPVLMVTTSIAETELLSELLLEEKIPHNVLNANNVFWEAEIIKEAGRLNAVTVATSMAGRGTDIKLGTGVRELGGLAVIGVGRMENIRQERQARGRSGRQGDPGWSQFYVSLQDEIVRANGPKNMDKYMNGKRKLSKGKLKRIINTAQITGEEIAVISRKQAVEYDQVLQRQRELIYHTRNGLLDGEDINEKRLIAIAKENIKETLFVEKELSVNLLSRYVLDNISYCLKKDLYEVDIKSKKAIMKYLVRQIKDALYQQRKKLGGKEELSEFVRIATLQAIDDAWVEQVDYLQQLQAAVSGRSSAQRNPIYEYQKEALESFKKTERAILINMIRNILLSNVYYDENGELKITLP